MNYQKKQRGSIIFTFALGLFIVASSSYANDEQKQIDEQKEQIEILTKRLEALEQNTTKIKFKGAPLFSDDDNWSMKIRGRLQSDFWSTSGLDNDEGNISGTEMRRARLGVEGSMTSDFKYKFEIDFAGNRTTVKDAYVQYKGFKDMSISVGNKGADFSIEAKSSSRYTDFIERSIIVNAMDLLGGSRTVGVFYDINGKNWHWSAQLSGEGVSNSGDNTDNSRIVSRFHYAPKFAKRDALHFGGWTYKENYDQDTEIQVTGRIDNHFNDITRAKSGVIHDSSGVIAYGLESAIVKGPFSLTGEYLSKTYSDKHSVNPTYSGYYVSGSYFLTGESKNYKSRSGLFSRVSPISPVTSGGIGAWQILLRGESADFDDQSLAGDKVDVYTLGLNWWPTAYTRVIANYAAFKLKGVQNDSGHNIGLRVQVDW